MGTKHAGIQEPALRGSLGGSRCPDPMWNGGRGLYLSGPATFLGAWQVLTASAVGQPATVVPPVTPPEYVVPPGTPEGSIPFAEQEDA